MPRHLSLIAALLLCTAPLQAQTIQPGLWEISNTMRSADGQLEPAMSEMQQQMAAMAPDQRKMMEEMMAKQGVKLGNLGGGGVTVKMCLTPEMVHQHQVPLNTVGDCTSSRSASGAKALAVRFECRNPPSHGEGSMTFLNERSYTMKMNVTSLAGGTPRAMSMEANAHWLAADCGNIKPPALPRSQ
jgi:hypothetical protein